MRTRLLIVLAISLPLLIPGFRRQHGKDHRDEVILSEQSGPETTAVALRSRQSKGTSSKDVSAREPSSDPNNLFKEQWMPLAGTMVPGGSWDGSDAVRARAGTPWFNVGMYDDKAYLWEKLRGKWAKFYVDSNGGSASVAVIDMKTRKMVWIKYGTPAIDPNKWRRVSFMGKFPDEQFESPTLYYYSGKKDTLYDNFRIYPLGTEPAELLAPIDQVWNSNFKNLIEDPSFEEQGQAAVLAPGWNLEKGGARIVEDTAHTGNRSLLLMSDTRVITPTLEAEKDVSLRVHFWARGRGSLSVLSQDLDAVGVPLPDGVSGLGRMMVSGVPMTDAWIKIELTSSFYNADCRSRRLDFTTSKDSEITIDDVQILRDTAVFPFSEKQRNPFKGQLTATGGTLEGMLGGTLLAEASAGITGPTTLVLKVTKRQSERTVQVGGGLTFADGGFVGPDSYWKMTEKSPTDDVYNLNYDDSAWAPVPLSRDGKYLEVSAKQPVWLRRVILWNTTPYLVPQIVELPFDRGRADWLNLALAPPLPTKITAFELLVDVPAGYRVLPWTGWGAYVRPHEKVEEDPRGAMHGGEKYRRFVTTYNPDHITGIAGAYRGGQSRVSTVLLEHTGSTEPVEGKLYLTRVANGNAVDFPQSIDLVQVKLDGTRPKQVMVHDLLTNPYTVGNPPNAQLNIEAVDKIIEVCVRSGMTHSAWPSKWVGRPYLFNPEYGPRWMEPLRQNRVELMPQNHNWPWMTFPGDPTYDIARRSGAVIDAHMIKNKQGQEVPEYAYVSFGWLLSDESRQYWDALREEYRKRTTTLEEGSGLKVFAYWWDYEFEIPLQGIAGDQRTLTLFAEQQKLPEIPNWETAQQKYSGQWHNFSRWACRQIIQRTYERAFTPLDLSFHVYYGEGRPFDRGNCDIISAWGVGQNISGQIPSVKWEYERMSEGLKIDPNIRFLGILQAEIQAVHRGRPFHWQELRNNVVKRVIATHGGGVVIYTEVEPQCPALPYGTAAATRVLAQWEPYFVKPDPVFAGEELEEIVKVDPMPADIVLLKKGSKGLLILFGGEPEQQPKPVTITVTPGNRGAREVTLAPMGLEVVELDEL